MIAPPGPKARKPDGTRNRHPEPGHQEPQDPPNQSTPPVGQGRKNLLQQDGPEFSTFPQGDPKKSKKSPKKSRLPAKKEYN